MTASRGFLRDLKLMGRGLRPFFFNRYQKWMIVRDFERRVPGITDYDSISGKNFIVEMVIEDERHNPLPLDGRVLLAIKECLYYKHSKPFSWFYQRIKQREEKRAREAGAERLLRFKDAGRDIHKFMTSETFVLGG